MTAYKLHLQVLSHHCDSTGIVHFPRYHEMANSVVEQWFDEALDWSYARMQGGENASAPVVQSAARFPTASRLGDHLIWRLAVSRIGNSSIELQLIATCGGETRVEMDLTLVLSELGVMRPRRWPDEIRARAADFLSEAETA
ncbi:MAG: hotdog domain-containing protein [Paracoccaceae bacterium]|nr:hotdog domain-containing protein [Paracoccaceae bacterium]